MQRELLQRPRTKHELQSRMRDVIDGHNIKKQATDGNRKETIAGRHKI